MFRIIRALSFAAIALAVSALAPIGAHAQQLLPTIVTACSEQALTPFIGRPFHTFMDITGNLCTNATGGSGGGTVNQGTAGSAAQAWFEQIVNGGNVVSPTNPLPGNIAEWNSVALGSPTAWGTAPTGNVPGANVNLIAGGVPTFAAGTTPTSFIGVANNSGFPLFTTFSASPGNAISIDHSVPGTTDRVNVVGQAAVGAAPSGNPLQLAGVARAVTAQTPGTLVLPGIDPATGAFQAVLVGGQALTSAPGTAPGGSNTSQIQGCGPTQAVANCIPTPIALADTAVPVVSGTLFVGAYTAGMSLGGQFTMPVARSMANPGGQINAISVGTIATPLENVQLEVLLFNQPPGGACADHTTFTMTDALFQTYIGSANLTMAPGVTNAQPFIGSVSTTFSFLNGEGTPTVNVYACALVGSAVLPTPVSGNLFHLILNVSRD